MLAAANWTKLQREYDALQMELAEQKRVGGAAARTDRRTPGGQADEGETVPAMQIAAIRAEPELPERNRRRLEDGRVRGGKIAYHKLKLAPDAKAKLQVSGEIENRSRRNASGVYLHIELYGKGGKPVDKVVVTIDQS